jgi:pyocin large subunit-like protein
MPFRNNDELRRHFFNHRAEFGAASSLEYERLAEAFLCGPLPQDTAECTRPGGGLVRYNEITREFGVLRADGFIATYYRRQGTPDSRRRYFDENCGR